MIAGGISVFSALMTGDFSRRFSPLIGGLVSFNEWWRLSNIGFSVGLMLCGFILPFVNVKNLGVLVGGSVFLGSVLSAGTLAWQRSVDGPRGDE